MTTDEEKSKITKLLTGIDVPDVKLSERCLDLVKEFHKKYDTEIEEEEAQEENETDSYDNPYKVDHHLIQDINRKLKELHLENKR